MRCTCERSIKLWLEPGSMSIDGRWRSKRAVSNQQVGAFGELSYSLQG